MMKNDHDKPNQLGALGWLILVLSTLLILVSLAIYLDGNANRLSFLGKSEVTITASSGSPFAASSSNLPELRAVWVQARSITSPAKAKMTLDRVEKGHFNAIFVNVFVYGQTLYDSALTQKYDKVEPNFDPLAYLITEAHRRNLQVHAWLVAGPVGGLAGPILSKHPDWAMLSLDGEKANWLNYNRPDVRQFIIDLSLELVKKYQVDGIHFDYTRYPHPGWKWGFDSYSASAFAQVSGLNLDALRYQNLPAYGSFKGNPLAGATTAQTLAVFDDGQPAILLNRYGAGEVLLFNWNATARTIAASTVILHRGIDYLLGSHGSVYLLRSETNAKKYGYFGFDNVSVWLKDSGWTPNIVNEADITTLDADSVLIMPEIYLISPSLATDLVKFVKQGGGIIFIDGPTPSIKDKNIQAITGMSTHGEYFDRIGLLIPVGEHNLIPRDNQQLKLTDYLAMDNQWKAFRQQGINKLLQDVYQQVKQAVPQTMITITVAGDQTTLDKKHFLDWQAWLEGQYIDLIIPRTYAKQNESLEPMLNEWLPAMRSSGRIMLGLNVFASEGSRQNKDLNQSLAEIALARNSGSKGIILFDLEGMSDEFLDGLATGPFTASVKSQ